MALLGFVLEIHHSDGSVEKEHFDPDEEGTLDTMVTNLFMESLQDVDSFTVRKITNGD